MPPTTDVDAADAAPLVDPAPGWALPGWWPWGAGVFLGLVVLGPGLGGGSLLSLDLLVTPHIPIPNGVFGLGPALSQRVPLFALIGGLSALVGGPVAVKALVVGCTAVGFAGAARLARLVAPPGAPAGALAQLAAGLLWAGGPYALTRLSAGHLNLLWVVAVLPWALPRLCRPAEHLGSTFLASMLLAVGGPGGGTLGVAMGLIAVAVQARRGRILRPALAVLVPQLLWVAPTAVLLWAGAGVKGAGGFQTWVDGSSSWAAVAAGNGFWRYDFQVGAAGWVGAVAGVLVVAGVVVAGRDLLARHGVRSWMGTATVVAWVGLALALASALPGVRSGYDWLSDLPFGAPLRESQRFLALWLVWAAPLVPLAAAQVARQGMPSDAASDELGGALSRDAGSDPTADQGGGGRRVWRGVWLGAPVVLALALSVPGWWGLDGRLEPVDYPTSWAAARARIAADPGTAVALPWTEYPPLSFAGGRQVFNPVPEYLGGDVISSYDPAFDTDHPEQEQVDPRADVVDRLAVRAAAGEQVSDDLAKLGVRWVVLVHESDWRDYASLAIDPGLRPVLREPDLDLYEVTDWSGRATAPDGSARRLDRPVPPVLTTDAPPGSILHVGGAPGWVQGWGRPVAVTADGQLRIEGGSGVLWFWPSVVLFALDIGLIGASLWAVRSRRVRFGRILAL